MGESQLGKQEIRESAFYLVVLLTEVFSFRGSQSSVYTLLLLDLGSCCGRFLRPGFYLDYSNDYQPVCPYIEIGLPTLCLQMHAFT